MDERDRESDGQDEDRAAILARRRRFILTALGGLTGVGGCHERESSSPPEHVEVGIEGSHEPVRTTPRVSPPPHPIHTEELRELLQGLDLCVDKPFAQLRLELTEDQKQLIAQALFERGRQAREDGDFKCAVELLEWSYYLVPGKLEMAFHVGEAAMGAGDCNKAREYLEHYLRYADHEIEPGWRQRAQEHLDSAELRTCERPPVYDVRPDPCLNFALPSPPPPPPETERERRRRERDERKAEREASRASKMFRPRKQR